MDNIDIAEKEFLSILVLKPKIGLDLLQIKPNYLNKKIHQELFKAIIESKRKYNVVDISTITSINKNLISVITDIISDENIAIIDVRKQFMTVQKIILENYKKQVINKLTIKLANNQIDCDEYLKKMESINTVVIKDETNVLTVQEINENIDTKKMRIQLKSYPKLNETLELVRGDLLMVGGSTGTGKSGLLLNFMNELMDDYQCIYFNMEMAKSTIYKRIIAIKSGIQVKDIADARSDYQQEHINKAIEELANCNIIIEHKASYINEIKSVLAKHKDDTKHTIVFLDHIGLIKSDYKKSIYEQTTDVTKQLRQFCLDYDCTIISACQLNRSSYNSNELNLSMLKDSGELENSASKVILLCKNKEQKEKEKFVDNMVVEIVKNRDGRLGKIAYIYDKTKQIFKEEINYD